MNMEEKIHQIKCTNEEKLTKKNNSKYNQNIFQNFFLYDT